MNIIGGLLSNLVTFVFDIVATIVNFIMTPFINAVMLMFPDLTARYNDFVSFLSYAFTYLSCILQWLLFSPTMFIVLFDYFAIKFGIFVLSSAIRFGLNIYNKLKP